MVPIIWVHTGFTLPENMCCLKYGFRLFYLAKRVCGAYYDGSD